MAQKVTQKNASTYVRVFRLTLRLAASRRWLMTLLTESLEGDELRSLAVLWGRLADRFPTGEVFDG